MAKHQATWTPDVDNTEKPATHPKTREELVQENRARREAEPAAAPQETDSETGTPASVAPAPRTDPARTPAVNVAETQKHDVRAGPGDAGRQDTPEQLPATPPRRPSERARGIALAIFIVGVLVAATMWLGAA